MDILILVGFLAAVAATIIYSVFWVWLPEQKRLADRRKYWEDVEYERTRILLERLRSPDAPIRRANRDRSTRSAPARESHTNEPMTPVFGGLLFGDGRGVALPEVEPSSYTPDSTTLPTHHYSAPVEACNSRSIDSVSSYSCASSDSGSSYDSGSSIGGGSSGSFD